MNTHSENGNKMKCCWAKCFMPIIPALGRLGRRMVRLGHIVSFRLNPVSKNTTQQNKIYDYEISKEISIPLKADK
jgi:hypothetical protein